MRYRALGSTGMEVSSVSFGAWAIGGTWGPVDDERSMQALGKALDLGINFFDTADVYGDGHSERLLGRLRRERKEPFYVATKFGRRANPHVASSYTRENMTAYVERSLENLGQETLDLVQLHCPPTDVYYMPEVFGVLDDLVRAGKVYSYGVSVERVEEALKAIEYPGVQTVQIVFNLFRQRPAERFFDGVRARRLGVIARLPLASGMLTGKFDRSSTFAEDDHRSFNREGAAFDRGETFAGVDFELGLSVVSELRQLVPAGWTLPELAIAWILGHDAVGTVIPGAKTAEQVSQNARAADRPALDATTRQRLRAIYEARLKQHVHQRW